MESGNRDNLDKKLKIEFEKLEQKSNRWTKEIQDLRNRNKNMQADLNWYRKQEDFQFRKQNEVKILKIRMYAQKSITHKWINKYKEENAKLIESLKESMNNQKDQLEQNEKLIHVCYIFYTGYFICLNFKTRQYIIYITRKCPLRG